MPVNGVPWMDEGQHQLSRLAPSVCQLSGDICTFRAELLQASGRAPVAVFELLGGKASAEPQSVCL